MDPRRVLPALTTLACACVVATLVVTMSRVGDRPTRAVRPASAAAPTAAEPEPEPEPARILAAWDERRAAAWAAGDVEALRALYVTGSRSAAVDGRLLGHYVERGLTVEGLRTQVLALDVVEQSTRRLVVRVTDRVVGGRAVGGTASVVLPVARASTRRVVLVRSGSGAGEEWLVAEAQASPAASTSRTSSSSKS